MPHKFALFAITALSSIAFAAEPTGTWNGKMDMDFSSFSAKERKQAEASIPKIKFVLNFKSNKTYTSTVTGSPDGKAHTSTGKWSQKGNAVTLMITSRDNKPSKDKSSQTFLMSKDGKTMTLTLRPNPQTPGNKTPSKAPSATITLKKVS